jgi:hypothetical protein
VRRTLVLLAAIAALAASATAAAPAAPAGPAGPAGPGAPVVPRKRPAREGNTDCGACHVESRWSEVRFNHEKTGFPLGGAHTRFSCRGCHRQDFKTRVPDTCAGCHRDRHAGEFGLHCEGCHEDSSWRAVLFFGDGHRRTSFPLTGKHSVIPCQECHGNMRDRTFERAPLPCVGCHRPDFDGARLTSIDHVAAGFGTDCQSCHDTWSFFPARFAAHDVCFEVSKGSHRPFRCQQCHSSIAGLAQIGQCTSPTITCTSCHSHECARTEKQHTTVMGYACVDAKCYECHPNAGR